MIIIGTYLEKAMKNNKIKKFIASVLVCTMCFSPVVAHADNIDNILFGSWDGTTTNHGGSYMSFGVTNGGTLQFDVTNYSDVKIKIDDGEPTVLTNQTYNLGGGSHEVSLFVEKVTNRKEGVTFNSANLSGGSFVPSKKEQYLFIGDSLFEGFNVLGEGVHSYENSIPYQIGEIMGVTPVAIAAPGSGIVCKEIFSTVEDMAFKNDINCNPTKIFISAGSNDIKLNIAPLVEKASYQHLIDTIKEEFPDAKIYGLVPLYGQAYSDVLHQLDGIEIIDTRDWQITFVDKIHPDAESQRIYAENVCAYLGNPVYEDFDAATNFPSTILDPEGIAKRAEIMKKRGFEATTTAKQAAKGLGKLGEGVVSSISDSGVTNAQKVAPVRSIIVDVHE